MKLFQQAKCALTEEFVDGVYAIYELYEFRYVLKDRVIKMYFEAFLN